MMKTRSAGVALIFLSLLLVFPSFSEAETWEPIEKAVLRDINSIRSDMGLQTLRPERAATAAATLHAEELGERVTLSHRGLDGTRVNDRYRLAGGTALKSGENLGAGDSVDSIISAWMDSPAHRYNILNPDWFHAGVGCYRLAGGRVVLVIVFSDSRWEQNPVTLSETDLIISGKIVLSQGNVPEKISIIAGNFRYTPLFAVKSNEYEMDIVFQIPRPVNRDSSSKFSYFLNLVEIKENLITDLVIVDSPVTL